MRFEVSHDDFVWIDQNGDAVCAKLEVEVDENIDDCVIYDLDNKVQYSFHQMPSKIQDEIVEFYSEHQAQWAWSEYVNDAMDRAKDMQWD